VLLWKQETLNCLPHRQRQWNVARDLTLELLSSEPQDLEHLNAEVHHQGHLIIFVSHLVDFSIFVTL
jgi:hypothetical protein